MARAVAVRESLSATPRSALSELDLFHLISSWGTNLPRVVELSVLKISVSRVSFSMPGYSVLLRFTPEEVRKPPRFPEMLPCAVIPCFACPEKGTVFSHLNTTLGVNAFSLNERTGNVARTSALLSLNPRSLAMSSRIVCL